MTPPVRRLAAATAIVAVVAMTGLAATACGGHSAARTGLGPLPSWLPTAAAVHRVEVATDAAPVYASQGDAVDIRLGAGSVRMTVTGPATPGQGLNPQPAGAFCTWTVTVVGEAGSVPLSLKDFSSLDATGRLYGMSLTQGEAAPPATIGAGQRTTFLMRANMPTGEGLLHWEPGGRLSPVAWDFTVETD